MLNPPEITGPAIGLLSGSLRRDGLENTPHRVKVFNVAFFGAPRNLIEPANRLGFKARLREILVGIDHVNLDFDGILPPLDPAFPFFASFSHGRSP